MNEKGQSHNAGRNQRLQRLAREERKFSNEFAQIVWGWLRNRKCSNQKFRREFVIEPYVVDFCCVDLQLIVEVDGESHFTNEGKAHDFRRDQYLNRLGFQVIRIPGYQVTKRPGETQERLKLEIKQRLDEKKTPPRPPGGEGAGG